MIKFYSRFLLAAFLVFTADNAMSQQVLSTAAQIKELSDISNTLSKANDANRKKAYEMALKKNWPTSYVTPAGTAVLTGVDAAGAPVYVAAFNNAIAAATTRTNTLYNGGGLGLSLNGSSTNMVGKLAEWDEGRILSHQEFAGKTITAGDASTTVSEHSTHVAGTMIAAGVYPPARGMSYGATSLLSYDFNNDAAEMAVAAPNLLLSNHSYGYITGWNYNSTNGFWYWYGLPGDSEDYRFGFYDSSAQNFDNISFNQPKYLIVMSSGNSRTYVGPAVGTAYYGYNSRTDFTFVNKGPRPSGISSNNGYDILSPTQTAKNILTIGAVNPLPYGPNSAGDVLISDFSSIGPTDDGRVKPDICGDGVNVLSTGITGYDSYLTLSGTSMASPNVCGSLNLLQEYYSQKNAGTFMLAATLKGLVCHTAVDAGNPGPDYIYGWGLLDMQKAVQALIDNGGKSIVSEKTLAQGQTQTFNVVASGNGPLKATIVWTDPAGTPGTAGVINNRTPKLVNDLDIRVSDGTNITKPWVLDPTSPATNATTGDNIVDNVEQVYIPNAVPGTAYTITVTHKRTLVNGSQNYSLIVTGVGGAAYCASGPSSSADSRINNVTISNINNTPGAGCTTYSKYTNLVATLEQGKTYPLSVTLGTCGGAFNKIAKVFIDWNGNGVFDANETVATSGVISAATGTFTANVAVPLTVVPGNVTLMRVVLTETSDPATVTACGTYAKGETQDYEVTFTKVSTDVGVIAINSPAPAGICPSGATSVAVRLKNYGTTTLSFIPVTVTLTSGTGVVTTISDIYNGSLAPSAEADFTLSGTFAAASGSNYTITATTTLVTDPITTNNQVSSTAQISLSPTINTTNSSVIFCSDSKTYNMTIGSANTGNIFWYKTLTGGTPIAKGSPTSTSETPDNNTFYAGLDDFSYDIGPATKTAFTAGNYLQSTGAVNVTTTIPMTIKSARLYIGNSGKITFTASTEGGAVVSSTTLDVVATRPNPGPGALADDAADVGAVYNINLNLPAAGNYVLGVSFPDGSAATLFRSNGGVGGYPFTAPLNLFSIVKNNATSGTDVNYYKNFYYHFYNMHIQSLACAAAARVAVTYTKPTITLSGNNLVSNFATGNQWYLNGTLIPGATGQTYTPLSSGIYRVDVSVNSGCITRSDELSYVLPPKDPNADGAEISLGVFPIPSNGIFNLAFIASKAGSLSVSVLNSAGQNVYKGSVSVAAGPYNNTLNLSTLPSGTYFMQLTLNDKTYMRRITIAK